MSEVRIALDMSGIRFVPNQPPPGHECVTFSFSEQAQQRVVQWGNKHNILQFIVQDGTERMAITLVTPGIAVDVSYACYRIQQHRKRTMSIG